VKILVTGGCGFIGSNFIHYVLAKHPDYSIVNLDKLTYAGNPENLADLKNDERYSFIKGDICDATVVEKAINGVDAIVNFAAETHVDRSILSAGSFVNTDVYGTYILLEAVKKHKIKRYIQISTDEIYGSIEKGSFTEQSPLNPNSPYAASKASGDLLVRAYYKTYNLPLIITRSSNNFGPFQYPEKFIPLFITNALSELKLPLYGDGKNVRDWIYVEDNCEAIDLVLRNGNEGEVYNIGGGNERKNIEIVKIILKKLGKPESIIEYVKDRPGHDQRYSLDCSKIKKEFGWSPKYNFEEALSKTVDWYSSNIDWWKKIKEKQKEFKEFYSEWYQKR
jgi:dTDP-glucose 4,6-dehydratase